MAVPDFQSMFVPFLQILSDGCEHTTKNMTEDVAKHFGLSNDDCEEMLPSGNQ